MKVSFSDIITILTNLVVVNKNEQLIKKQQSIDTGLYEMEFHVSGKNIHISFFPKAMIDQSSFHIYSFVSIELTIDTIKIASFAVEDHDKIKSLMTLYSLASVSIPSTTTRRKEALELCINLAK